MNAATSCYLCEGSKFRQRPGQVRDNPDLKILECQNCRLVFLSGHEHIADTHYADSGMHGANLPTLAEWLKDTDADDERRFRFLKAKLTNKRLLDFGCGVGGFLIKAKSVVRRAEGVEPESRLREHFKNHGIGVANSLSEAAEKKSRYDIITAFHVIEHLKDPAQVLGEIAGLLESYGEIIIEVPSADDALLTLYDSEPFSRFTYWSQHLFLFNNETFRALVQKSGLKLNWSKQIQRYPLSNHLHWLAKGTPGGHKTWAHLDSPELQGAYEAALSASGLCDTLMASISRE